MGPRPSAAGRDIPGTPVQVVIGILPPSIVSVIGEVLVAGM